MIDNIDEVTDKRLEALEAIEKVRGELLEHITKG
jgi:hypothetical protein